MARFVAYDAIFFLVPFAAYAGYLLATRGHVGTSADWSVRMIAYLAISGAVLMTVAVIIFIQFDTARGGPDLKYVPAKVENGKIVQGHFE